MSKLLLYKLLTKFRINTTIQTIINNPSSDVQKRIAELEKNYKLFMSSINIDMINKEFIKINEELNKKASKDELKDLRELYSK